MLGRMVVHDRARVEAEVLPRYFNHASFASLRRQLNYFSFTRVGKGRQRGATYCNDGVIVLDDILSLKRRPSGAAASRAPSPPKHKEEEAVVQEEEAVVEEQLDESEEEPWNNVSNTNTAKAVVPFVHLPPSKKRKSRTTKTDHRPLRKKSRFFKRDSPTAVISPLSTSPPTSEDELAHAHHQPRQQVILDLTKPSTRISSKQDFQDWKLNPNVSAFESYQAPKDDDLMAGCAALLSFSNQATHFGSA